MTNLLRVLLILLINHICITAFSQKANVIDGPKLSEKKLVGFVRNIGQVRSMETNRSEDAGVYFVLNSPEATVYITRTGLSYVYAKRIDTTRQPNSTKIQDTFNDSAFFEIERVDAVLEGAVIDSSQVEITYSDNPIKFNYYNGAIAVTNQRLIKKIIFKNVYKGIDWVVFYSMQGNTEKLTYDFVINAPGKLEDIAIRYSPNARLQTNADKSLIITSKMGFIKETPPVGFNENDRRKKILMSYEVTGNYIRFKTHGKIRYPFIVDPDLYWGTMLNALVPFSGNGSRIRAGNIATDSYGNIYTHASCTGIMNFPMVDPGNGAYFSKAYNSNFGSNIYLKFNEKGVLLWASYFAVGGNGGGIAIDSEDNLIASSYYTGGTLPFKDIGGYFDKGPYVAGWQAYLAKFDQNGRLIWCSQWAGGTLQDITSDGDGNFYITGDGRPPHVDPGNGAYMAGNPIPGNTPYIAKFDRNCRLVWSTEINGGDALGSSRIAVDKKKNVYLLKGGMLLNSYPLINAGGFFSNIYGVSVLTKFDASLKMVWSTSINIRAVDIDVDTSCNVFVIGNSAGGFPYVDPGSGAYMDAKRNSGAFGGGCILKFEESTNLVWSTTYDAGRIFFFSKIVYEKYRNQVHIYGYMNDTVMGLPTRNDDCKGSYYASSAQTNNMTDALMVSFTAGGKLTYATLNRFPYQYYDAADLAVDVKGNLLYVFQTLDESNFGPTGAFGALKNPGNGAYFESVTRNNYLSYASAIMKLTPSLLGVTTSITPPANCACTGSLSVNPTCGSGNYSYLWSTGATTSTITNVCAGDYSVTITDLNSNSKVIVPFSLPNPSGNINSAIFQVKDDHCNSAIGSITVSGITGGQGQYQFSLNGQSFTSNPVFNNISAGNYQLTIKDNSGCQINKMVTVKNIGGPTRLFSTITATACDRSTGQVIVDSIAGGTSPFIYSINNSIPSSIRSFQALGDGTHTVIVKDSAGCLISETVTVQKHAGAVTAVTTSDNGQCGQLTGEVSISKMAGGTRPFLFSLDNTVYYQDSVFRNLPAGKYYLYAKDANGCIYKDSASFALRKFPLPLALPADTVLCDNATYSINAIQANLSYLWQDGSVLPNYIITKPGNYSVKITNADNCTLSQTLDVIYQNKPDIFINKDILQCVEDTLRLNITFPDATYLWQDGKTSPTYNIFKQGLYSYTVSNFCGSSYGAINVSTRKCLCEVTIPNAFSPNGDGINDKLLPAYECTPASYRFSIYNRGGQIVFETTDPSKAWDGTQNGKPVPFGTYYYILKIKGISDPVERQKSGGITIIR